MYIKYNFKGVTMFCVQCEQTIRTPAGNGCSYAQGMCGKTAETSDLQDLLIASLQGLSAWALKAREYGIIDHEVDSFAPRAFFSTLTKEGANKQVISSQADSLIKISRIWADFFPANTSNQPI